MSTRARLAQLKLEEYTATRRAAEIAKLEEALANRPEEPPVDATIAFTKTWSGSHSYSYVAYQAIQGWWYLSQSNYRTQPRMLWDDLLDFIDDSDIFIVTAWEQL